MEEKEGALWKERIRQLALESGFADIGFTHDEPIEGLYGFLEERSAQGYHTSFEEKELRKRVDPKAIWPACETVVVLAYPLAYSSPPQRGEGVLARSAVGEDYHSQVKKALHQLVSSLGEAGWRGEKPQTQVDTGPLNERALATRAGLGWLGKNQQLIIPGKGSFVALGLMLLDKALPPDEPLDGQCGNCTRCIAACPAQILGAVHFQANQCLSYLTQSKEPLTELQRGALGNRIFGCDTCQEACPHNRLRLMEEENLPVTDNAEEDNRTGAEKEWKPAGRGVNLWDTLNLTKSQYNQQWKGTAAGWRGKGILQRNAYFALKNRQEPRLQGWEKERREQDIPKLIQPYLPQA
ncbi:MAG TPA: tRNA epoxyqueuosine(34) reductase QueG [Desulfitobacterium dehalogenans]|uniref:tRNA epoxyqueuosine(34) reductase QueG n=1 Tax=Desulfitobacterium dehalogenans TaxID=36854 RepID=A0A7C6Z7I0_9FIRM|nr:tRNA epoxyqueuosine(34) reductase QueG [Desulfitobacterium dehalogenans]